ncbi:2-succinyl-5-enolpyruvyl-6-hydroxy-3-cyclohexene-1-carboxylic-acid synthase [Halobacillus halophilus]|uniref:2-succinyl-5-enolpyruvyl-6-hydroxy-3-cyclohexene-1-carboxylate synthase n=1 Tax=Halobacillus halophilus (strain ATCC 35676 / DSM 2266 / JCM 20832 / KCTC 3685 / LMG 17431 / NBRC 102448 / NCIMB 2269) TaxID=866895 RepID=I0JPY6_HALH3|nr:2-succinyl-5-enolpyruvyl-6-hydroxy-3-cyclohexene-1-carboxylic-acid synthase [Halobacillus halophilus]ASF40229.1 2-succinyl-5-enolpyruvyl-6-hydroxy-3-cyclohexene-1-carboxylic-acid synthase [Halobacillus halophilus]CCG46206.1 2-succinyl-6-hydroxy-2,4-cyclohexadiene-1-carboxylic acid synthase/2-oxoglutarate decarboxylase [Halobacillus halophilus DSM 2266]
MEHVESLTKYVTHFVDQLVFSGIEHVVISPGSRSTPLAMTLAEHSEMNHWVHLDERSAAFFALGIAKEQHKPVALVCTSGTAAANYYPAIVEAYYSRVPLLVLTADRPHELRDTGAPQAIDQTDMFGSYVRWYQDLAVPGEGLHMYARRQAARAVEEAVGNHPGPVHLNLPFREPLIPDFSLNGLWREGVKPIPRAFSGKPGLQEEVLEELFQRLNRYERGVIVVGPQADEELAPYVTTLAARLGVPILADPLSQLRAGAHDKSNIIENYDALLKSERIQGLIEPDYILRFGAMPVSKAYLKWVKKIKTHADHFIVDTYKSYREPAGITAQFIWSDPAILCSRLSSFFKEGSYETDWLELWHKLNSTAKNQMLSEPEDQMNEGHAVVYLSEALPDNSNLFVGNSMPIRDVDSFFMSTPKSVKVLANRGANGIDGVLSAALGSSVSGRRTTLLLGDLSFYHDFNGMLIAKHKGLPLTIVVINNNGGGIFSYLPQVNHPDHFEELFGTPLDLDFSKIVEMYGGVHRKAENWGEYKNALAESYGSEGLFVVEVITNREDHVAFHKAKWQSIEESITTWSEDEC